MRIFDLCLACLNGAWSILITFAHENSKQITQVSLMDEFIIRIWHISICWILSLHLMWTEEDFRKVEHPQLLPFFLKSIFYQLGAEVRTYSLNIQQNVVMLEYEYIVNSYGSFDVWDACKKIPFLKIIVARFIFKIG